MHASTSNRARPYGLTSPRRLLSALVALAWLAVAAGQARADFIVYNFNGDSLSPTGFTLKGSFQVDEAVIQQKRGALTASDLQPPPPHFVISDGFTFDQFNAGSTFLVDTKTFDVLGANLDLKSSTRPGDLLITGSSAAGIVWTEDNGEVPVVGTGTVTHTTEVSAVPAPPTLALLGLGALCLIGYGWRRQRLAVA